MKTIRILDATVIDQKHVLLDGHGNELPLGASPVWIEFDLGAALVAANSRGERFNPGVHLRNNDGDDYE